MIVFHLHLYGSTANRLPRALFTLHCNLVAKVFDVEPLLSKSEQLRFGQEIL